MFMYGNEDVLTRFRLSTSLLLRLSQSGHRPDLWCGMLVCLFLLGEWEEPPGEFANRTANRPPQRDLLSPQVQVVLGVRFEQIEQVVFRADQPLILREIGTPATRIAFTEIVRVDDDQGGGIRAQRAIGGKHPAMQHAQEKAEICA